MITLKTLPQASAQEVFDQIKNHLLTQNKKSSHEELNLDIGIPITVCKYKTIQDGKTLKCAAGCLISDKEYDESMEGDPWGYLINRNIVPDDHSKLISKLQHVHDKKLVCDWPYYLTQVAHDFKLKE